jgi:hypothetical protein
MTTIQTIDVALLANVTGGAGQQCAAQQQQQPQQGDDQQQAGAQAGGGGGGGGFLAGLDGFLSFLQSSNFGQIIGGLRGILGTFAGQGSSQASQPQQQDAA